MRDKSQLSGLTVPVGGGKGKKNWEQLQQESTEGGAEPRTEGVQVGDSVQQGVISHGNGEHSSQTGYRSHRLFWGK